MTLLTLIGSISLFLFAMQLISDNLQKIAGDVLRHAQPAMTGNALTGMFTGLGVTALVQSSTAVTMMAVSFANTGMITLSQSMSVIMGANIGTTITAWIIALLCFNFDAYVWAFPLIALIVPLFGFRKGSSQSWGELILGIALLVIGIHFMQVSFDDMDGTWLPLWLDAEGYQHILAVSFILLGGLLLTVIFRSSSVTFLIALLLCVSEWISFELGCALIVVANIGTCIPPIFAARKGNAMARRAALLHFLFNFIGMFWILILNLAIYLLFKGKLAPEQSTIAYCCELVGLGNPHVQQNVPVCLAFFHTVFNVATMCLLLPLRHQLVKLVSGAVHEMESDTEQSFKLQYISSGMLSSSEMALAQVQKETARYGEEVCKMFALVREMLAEPLGSERQLFINDRIRMMEEESDRAEMEIADFLNKISPKSLSWQGEQLSRNLYKIVDELESVADSIYHISATLYSKSEQRVRFSPELNTNVNKMFVLTDEALQHMLKLMEMNEVTTSALNKAYNIEDEINNFRNQYHNSVLDQFDRNEVQYQQSTFFMMLINECEKIGDYIINVVTALEER